MKTLSANLIETIDTAEAALLTVTEEHSIQPALPGGWSRAQFVQDASWSMLIALWASYNRYLAHVIAHLPAAKLDVLCRIGSLDPMTLRFVAEDYLVHMRHHLAQIGITTAVPRP